MVQFNSMQQYQVEFGVCDIQGNTFMSLEGQPFLR